MGEWVEVVDDESEVGDEGGGVMDVMWLRGEVTLVMLVGEE